MKKIVFSFVAVSIVVVLALVWWFTAAPQAGYETVPTAEPTAATSVPAADIDLTTGADSVNGLGVMGAPDKGLAPADAPPVPAETATLAAVGTYTGSGTATRLFSGGDFLHTVTAQLDPPATGKFYEGWLVHQTASGPDFFSTGKMVTDGVNWTLSYSASQNYPNHSHVVVTEETESLGLDNNPEAHVLEGDF